MSFDGEGGHWYTKSGEPAYETNGRGTTLRDARKLSLLPSVTTVSNVRAKPALINWLIEQAVMAALTLPKVDGESDAAFLARIKTDGKASAKAAAEEGSRIHDAIEKSFLVPGGIAIRTDEAKYGPHVFETRAELRRLFPDVRDWVSEKSFAHPLGFGGKVDLHSPSTGIVVDFKTKDGDFSDGKRLHYDQNIQLAAYQFGLGLANPCRKGCRYGVDLGMPEQSCAGPLGCYYLAHDKQYDFTQCANIFVSRTHPGKVASHVWSADDIARGWAQFECELALWKCINQFDGSFSQ